ncbi:MAG: alpha/beta hydrolase [Thermoplasmata archaeon]|nr:alpha/beta hydrolase [Thermoplasmata archaeon]
MVEGSVARLEKIELGGVEQWILVRGMDPGAPILLSLHGGPGDAQIPFARRTQAELERAFIVVNWDQRGSGLSYRRDAPLSALTLDRLVEDTVELSRRLVKEFYGEPIVLSGHSWGSILGLLAAARAPELYESYIGVSQVIDVAENEKRLFAWALGEARRRNVARAIREIEAAGPLPYSTPKAFRTVRRWVGEFGGRWKARKESWLALATLLDLEEYTLGDLFRYAKGQRTSIQALADDLAAVRLSETIHRLEVPTYFVSGRDDHISDPSLAREFLHALDAPRKGWAWIDDAAHLVPFEQPEAYAAALAHYAHDARGPKALSWQIAG